MAVRNWQAFVRERLHLPAHAPTREARIIRELAAQLEDFYREAIARGASEADADAHACAQIRDWQQLSRDVAQADRANSQPPMERIADTVTELGQTRGGGLKMLADFLRDMRYAARQLIKTPAFAIVAVLTLGLGIGATSAIFSVVNAVLVRPLPYPEAERLVRVHEIVPQYGLFSVAPATFLDWRQQNSVFEHIAAYNTGSTTIAGTEGPERVPSAAVSWDLFELLKVKPVLGRTFTAQEGTPVTQTVAIISYGAWQRRFGGDRSVLERPVTLNGSSSTIIGVMPPDFYFPSRTTEIWTPLAFNPANATRGGHFLGVIARTNVGVSVDTANTEMKTISERLAVQYPQQSANESAKVVQLLENIVGDIRPTLLTLLAAVGVVVLIACANVANLLLVRASVREKEIAIRAALGAGRRRLGLQMLAESVVLALGGGALGLLLAYLAIPAIKTLSAASIPRIADLSIDVTVLAFVASVSLLTGVIFGLAPMWRASRTTLGHVLKEGGRTSSSAAGRWVRNTLLVAEVGLSIVLLVGATLLLRSFAKLTSVDPGFHPERVLTFQVSLTNTSYPEPHNRAAFFSTLLEKLDALPDVASAGMVQTLPMRGDYVLSVTFQGRPAPPPNMEPSANYRVVSPKYFETLGIPLLRGRVFNDQDTEKSLQVAVVDQAFVDRHFPDENPIGHRIDIGNGGTGFTEIVGVVGSVHHESLDTSPRPTMYVPSRQDIFSSMWIMARTGGDPARLTGSVRQVMHEIDPALPAFRMGPLTDAVTESVGERRFSMLLLTAFAGIAVFLAAVGLYGVVAYTVTQRTQEIGLRMAIGARPGDVLRMVLAEGLKIATIGVVLGIGAAVGFARVIKAMLFNVTPFDAGSYSATVLLLLAIAALACYVPARRAMRVDPLVALRQE
jgi:putative ABC transport system permease protein